MKKQLRRILFWLHLGAGVTVGLIVATMALTGAAMSFEGQIMEWAERESRAVTMPAATPDSAAPPARLPIDEILARVKAARPALAVSALTVPADRRHAVRVSLGREDGVHVDPFTGEVRPLSGRGVHAVFAFLIRVHRFLGAGPDGREVGKTITGIANAGFFFMVVSGLVLWWPARWSRSALRAALWFRRGLTGRARDWSWHNVIGFWALPVLLVITSSGLTISYRPVSNLVYRLAGETPPPSPAPGGGRGGGADGQVAKPTPDARPLPLEALLAAARERVPGWTSMTVRMRTPGEAREGREAGRAGGRRGGDREGGADPITVLVKAPETGPRFSSMQLVFNPFTGALTKHERFADLGPGRRARMWLRYLHTGEALGPAGQFLNGSAAVGVLFLTYTGFALALRRLRRWRAQGARQAAPQLVEGKIIA